MSHAAKARPRLLAGFATLLSLGTSGALAQGMLPHFVTAPFASAPAAGITEDRLTWRAWPDALPSAITEGPASRAGFVARRGGVWGDVGGVASGRLPGEPWTLLVEGSGHVGVTRGVLAGSPQSFPPIELRPLPRPAAAVTPSGVEIAWEPLPDELAGVLEGMIVARSIDGTTWQTIGSAAAGSGTFVDGEPPEVALYALGIMLPGGVAGRELSAAAGVGPDADSDGLLDRLDRCAVFADPDQRDDDGDGVSEACEIAWGDVHPAGRPDGAITAGDIVRLLRFTVSLETPSDAELRAGDVAPADAISTGPGQATVFSPRIRSEHVIEVDDVALALRAAVGLASFPAPR